MDQARVFTKLAPNLAWWEWAISSFVTRNVWLNHVSMLFKYSHLENCRDRDTACGSFVDGPGLLRVLVQRFILITHPDDEFGVRRFYPEDLVDGPPSQDRNDTNWALIQKT